ncbi:MAG: metallophosphoesterase [Gammaproteobacteria bacterium]|nr:metallophosphoesterase [Gammaproteobacteria bacterium]
MKNPKISIAYASDLHLPPTRTQRRIRALNFPPESDVIVLAGDIAVGMQAADVAFDLAEWYPETHIVWIAGNHEFYGNSIDDQIDLYRKICTHQDRIHFLENDSVELFGIKFLGCTLWTDFSILGDSELAMEQAEQLISDFRFIRTRAGSPISPKFVSNKFQESHRFLDEQLAACDPQRTIVVTHFPPGMATANPNFMVSPLTAYFNANAEFLINSYQPALWIYGHNHFSNDLEFGRTRIVSNQLGYPSEDGRIPRYDPSRLIVLDTGTDDDTKK